MLKRKKYTFILMFFVIAMFAASFLPVDVPYSITTRAIVQPSQSWELTRLPDGSLSSLVRNELSGSIESYGVTEFRRGDVVSFQINQDLFTKKYINAGDTVGFLYSNDEQMRLAELKGEVEVIEAEINYYLAGEKETYLQSVRKEINLAQEALNKAEIVYQRSRRMMTDTLVSIEEYELDRHELEARKIALELAKSRLNVALSGDKPERILWLETRKKALSSQIAQLINRMEKLTMLSPMDGKIVLDRNYISRDVLLRVVDTTSFVGIAPVLIRDLKYLEIGSKVELRSSSNGQRLLGEVMDFNNVAEILNGEVVVYLTFLMKNEDIDIIPGSMIEVDITGVPLNPQQFAARLMRSPI
ncbi:MAG: hypothetical protein EA362_09285 [Saprospirales bacterium]|nr:MAG: hypothetical protein EA362_09285 [Saprospirales bacterium]